MTSHIETTNGQPVPWLLDLRLDRRHRRCLPPCPWRLDLCLLRLHLRCCWTAAGWTFACCLLLRGWTGGTALRGRRSTARIQRLCWTVGLALLLLFFWTTRTSRRHGIAWTFALLLCC